MSTVRHDTIWQQANQRYLGSEIARVHSVLDGWIASRDNGEAQALQSTVSEPLTLPQLESPATLELLCSLFGLSNFERDVLLLCAGMELEASFAALCARAQGDPQRAFPTFSLALAALPEAHWSALAPSSPLRYRRLIEVVGSGGTLVTSQLRIDERILHYLTGIGRFDEQLAGYVRLVASHNIVLPPSHDRIATQIASAWSRAVGYGMLPVIQLCGADLSELRTLALQTCSHLELNLYVMPAHVIPSSPQDLDILIRLWERESALGRGALLIECDDDARGESTHGSGLVEFIENVGGPLIVAGQERRRAKHRPILTFDVPRPDISEQHVIWRQALGDLAPSLNGRIESLVAQFTLNASAIRSACTRALGSLAVESLDDILSPQNIPLIAEQLWEACRTQARPRLDDLAERIEPAAMWDDLILPEEQKRVIAQITAHVRQRTRVYDEWGFASKSARGLGISALFAGPSGTGKTMAAEVLAGQLHLDLYRIDLSQVVSKYIGETEKNLERIFDAAEQGGAILLFDEADALFGKRSEVKEGRDRYANIEVSFLLQRMESYRGLAILTTNQKKALDTAFLRRIRFVVEFPFPDADHRAQIWRRIFPSATPTDRLDPQQLARLNVAGGNIRNIALNAAFLAADMDEPVRMNHLLHAARTEYAKLEKPLTDGEVKGWVGN